VVAAPVCSPRMIAGADSVQTCRTEMGTTWITQFLVVSTAAKSGRRDVHGIAPSTLAVIAG
jgi:hypothetical protein